METTIPFVKLRGPQGFFSIQGRVFHRLRAEHEDSPVHWIVYDGFSLQNPPHSRYAHALPQTWIEHMRNALLRINPYIRSLRILGDLDPTSCPEAHVILSDAAGCTPELAAIIRYDNSTQPDVRPRRLIVARTDNQNVTVPTTSRFWEPLSYPLFFPHGTLGWGIPRSDPCVTQFTSSQPTSSAGDSEPVSTQIWHYRGLLLREERFARFGWLTNEYVVDMFSRNLETRMTFIHENQRKIQEEDAAQMGVDFVQPNENVYLPASFLGSNRWASDQIADSLAIAAAYGPPTFFITMTCNPDWPEIKAQCRPGQTFRDVPVVVCRVFKQKLSMLEHDLRTMFPNAGGVEYIIHSVEFQKRGLPHAHILVRYAKDCVLPDDIDSVVSAEIPDDPADAQLVREFLIHDHKPYCSPQQPDGTRGQCRFHYPKPLQQHTSVDSIGHVHYRRRKPEDAFVVPHCLPLVRKYHCHINFEVANTSHIFQYLFKYIHKGPDRAKFAVVSDAPSSQSSTAHVDEINEYWDGRYLSAAEATWRILGFHITKKDPAVSALPVHTYINRSHHRQYGHQEQSLSFLERYFRRPLGTFIRSTGDTSTFDSLTYSDYFTLFRLTPWNASNDDRPLYYNESVRDAAPRCHVVQRQMSHPHVARLHAARPTEGERFYLRTILRSRPVRSFVDARTVDGIVLDTFQDAAHALGLFADVNEGELALIEGIQSLRTPFQLRVLYVHLLVNDCLLDPRCIWTTHSNALSLDCIDRRGGVLCLGEDDALNHIASLLEEYGHSLDDFALPHPSQHSTEVAHELARWNPIAHELGTRAQNALSQMNSDQLSALQPILSAAHNNTPLLVFIDGPSGTGKTFVVNALCDFVRSLGLIVLATATSAYAAQLLPGGRTTHSTFKIPVSDNNQFVDSTIPTHSSRADLIRESRVAIWDEAPMANKAVFHSVNDLFQRLLDNHDLFGGKIVVLLGDFRQTCPVVPRGSRAEVVDASIKSSPLWSAFHIYHLTIPVRNAEDPEFAHFVDSIGNGAGPVVNIDLISHVHSSSELISFVFPPDIVNNPAACLQRSILAPTNAQIDAYNTTIIDSVHGQQQTFFAADTLKEAADAGIPIDHSILDYTARHPPAGLPAHALTIKVNGVYRLVRNLSIDRGLVENARVLIKHIGRRLITVRLLRGMRDVNAFDDDVLIPRISFSAVLPSGHTLLRSQFPLAPAYATTFNSCQGLTLDRIAVDLIRPVFSHGQLYTALSRIRHRSHARVRLPPGETTTPNITYNELLV
uniref:ATP-dependent DNA helicase n=1 Tax=Ganoderma boninense TaxID=34458 RepID=A0A5K1K3W0_9APHY|nr:Ubiquitin carboxyl-terminal hydrolase 7 [Ganoderma boninense]